MSHDDEFSVEDGKLVEKRSEDLDFEENLTFEEESD